MAAAEGMFVVAQTQGRVLCCLCGSSMAPNPANMCVACLRSQVDITEGLQKHVTVLYCPDCQRYLNPPQNWIKAGAESRELLTFCIKRLKNLNKVHLVDAGFIWTEPHSKRLKVKLKIQKEVMQGAILEQSYTVEYVVQDHMCDACSRAAANPDQWVAAVQLRQKAEHKRTFYYVEQLLLKHGASSAAINIKQMHDGLDFFFSSRSHALKFVEFVGSVVPVKSRHDKQLVSHDTKNNSYNYKFTFSVEICPVCKDDLICLPHKVFTSLGSLGPLLLCTRVSNTLMLLDPQTLRSAFIDASQYWRMPYRSLMSSKQLVEYVVLDIEAAESSDTKYALAHAQVARRSDLGRNDTIFNVKTHLGKLLRPGDYALGYDMFAANTNDVELDKYRGLVMPEVVLVKKSYEDKRVKRRGKARTWALKSLPMDVEQQQDVEYDKFMDELEEDPEMRSKISLYRNPKFGGDHQQLHADDDDDEDEEQLPEVPLEELLADLTLRADDDDVDMGD